jgi:1-Cys peroxiredoxin 6
MSTLVIHGVLSLCIREISLQFVQQVRYSTLLCFLKNVIKIMVVHHQRQSSTLKLTQTINIIITIHHHIELGKAAELKPQFSSRNVKLCGFSCNDADSHKGWIEDIKVATGQNVTFPLFCDPDRSISTELGILDETNKNAAGLPMTVRSVFILKPDRTVALLLTYPASCGRNFDEILRVVDSLQLTCTHSVATPVNWKKGSDVIVNFPLTDVDADEAFGKGGYKVVDLPSEKDKDLPKHYLRYTKDPLADSTDCCIIQ